MIINVNNDEMLGRTVEKELYFELYNRIKEKDKEIQRLHSIIKEVREYIEENCIDDEFEVNLTFKERNIKKVLEILDKENK